VSDTPNPRRLDVRKTYKLFVNGAFERSESGRLLEVKDGQGRFLANACRGSRKDLKAAVRAAREALPAWAGKSAYNRGQILYRAAEMLESRRTEFEQELVRAGAGKKAAQKEVAAAVDRLVWYAGWADKYLAVLGSMNPVSGPFFNFSSVEPTGVVGIVAPETLPLLGLVSLLAPVLCGGNVAVAVVVGGPAGGTRSLLPGLVLGEVFATSDWPKGTVNLISGLRDELLPALADHMDVNGVLAAGLAPAERKDLATRGAENLKRVRVLDDADQESPLLIEPFVEVKTIWHPVGV
jgi:acyl-CoA reductase-like NAD-dependent aldehyde dehydrogenase